MKKPGLLIILILAAGTFGGMAQNRADWMQKARWGIMNHFLADWVTRANNLELNPEQWNKLVNGFEVKELADQLVQIGAGYYVLTIGQNSGYYLSPNPVYEKLAGTGPDKCSNRDLVSDMGKELKKRGIRLIVYLPAGAPAGDKEAGKNLDWQNGPFPNKEFQIKWEQVIREWSLRWGDLVSGWWFDGCYWPNSMYRSCTPPNFTSFAAAARAGNPNAVLAFNPGVVPRLITVSPEEDYIAGEINDPEKVEIRRQTEGRIDGSQIHVLTFLGETWGKGKPRFTAEQLAAYSNNILSKKGVITWDVPPGIDGRIPESYFSLLKSAGNLVK